MPYVKRDAAGRIAAIVEAPAPGADEPVPPHDPEIAAFLAGHAEPDAGDVRRSLVATDDAMARVAEDLIRLLVDKNLILISQLPAPAQDLLLRRRHLRGDLAAYAGLVGEDDVL